MFRRAICGIVLVLLACVLTLEDASAQGITPMCAGTACAEDVYISGYPLLDQTQLPLTSVNYNVTVSHTEAGSHDLRITCTSSNSTQLPCVGSGFFEIGPFGTVSIPMSYTVVSVGSYTHTLTLRKDDVAIKTFAISVSVPGPAFFTHVNPIPGDTLLLSDTLRVVSNYSSPVDPSKTKVWIDGVLQGAVASNTAGYTLRASQVGISSPWIGSHTWQSYVCATNGRCDNVTSTFRGAAGVTWALDDSLPNATSIVTGGVGMLGGLPLPPMNQRGCAVGDDDPEINTTPKWISQPGTPGVAPGGIVFLAAAVPTDQILVLRTTTVDTKPGDDKPHCSDYTHLPDDQFDWGYWIGAERTDPLWANYPFGDRLASGNAVDRFGPYDEGAFELAMGTPHGPHPGPGRMLAATIGKVEHTHHERVARRFEALTLARRVPDPGAIKPSTFSLTLNGTAIITGGVSVVSGVTLYSLDRVGATIHIAVGHALVRRYNPANPSSNYGGWNEIIAGISDSTNHHTDVRARFVVVPPGTIMPLQLARLRNFTDLDQGECAAFGAFQCGGVMLSQAIPGFVSRDKTRDLHLQYRSASQRQVSILPVSLTVQRDQKAPDSVWAWARASSTVVSDTLRYAGLAGNVGGGWPLVFSEWTDEKRAIAAEVRAPSSGDASIRRTTMVVHSFYTDSLGAQVTRDDTLSQDLVHVHLTDTASTHFGAGWQLAEIQRLVLGQTIGGVTAAIWLLGDGSFTIFQKPASAWVAPSGETARMVQAALNGATYVLYLESGAAVGFRSDGWQVWTRDLVGNYTTFSYAANSSRVTSITDPAGKRFDFVYYEDTRKGLVKLIARYGTTLDTIARFDYTGTGSSARLIKVATQRTATLADSTRYRYRTSSAGAFVDSIYGPRDSTARKVAFGITYDSVTWTPQSISRPGPGLSQLRSPWRRVSPRIGRGRGAATVVNGQLVDRMVDASQVIGTYVPFAGMPTDFGVDPYEYPTYVRRIAQEPIPMGGFAFAMQGGDDVRRISRDTLGRVTRIVAAPDSAAILDSVRFTYDALSRVTSIVRATREYPALASRTVDTLSFTYDSLSLSAGAQWCSRLKTSKDEMGAVTTVKYGLSGLTSCLPTTIIGAALDTTLFTYDPSIGVGRPAAARPVTVRGADTVLYTVAYDATHWNTSTATRNADNAITRSFYDRLGRADSIVDPEGGRTAFLRDRYGRATHSKTGTGALAPVARTTFDQDGNATLVDVYASTAEDLASPTGTVQSTRNYFSVLGFADSMVMPGSRTASSGYQARKQTFQRNIWGLPVRAYPGNGSSVTRLYDWDGRVKTVMESAFNLNYSFDAERYAEPATVAWLNSLLLPMGKAFNAGRTHKFTYTNRGLISGTWSYEDFLGVNPYTEHHYSYTRAGMPAADTLLFHQGPTVIRTYQYNRRGQRTNISDVVSVPGTLSGDASGSTTYVYDNVTGRLTSLTSKYGAANTTLASVNFVYDRAGRETLRTVGIEGVNLTTSTRYDNRGRVDSVDTKRSGTREYGYWATTYNKRDELLGYTSSGEPSPTNGAHVFEYSADHTRRLTRSTAGFNTTLWTYDVLGNRLSENVSSTSLGSCTGIRTLTYAADNRLLTRGALGGQPTCGQGTYFTDQAGQRIGEADPTYAGTAQQQLRSVVTYTASGQLYYSATGTGAVAASWDHLWNWSDAEGRRAITQAYTGGAIYPIPSPDSTTGTRTYYAYDGPNVSLEITRSTPTTWRVTRRHVMLGVDQEVAGRYFTGATDNLFIVNDRQGSMVKAITKTGNIVSSGLIRGAFGERQGTGAGGSNAPGSGFTGAASPAQAGYTYLRNRWYDPTTGRFLTQDPIGLAGGVNLYAYAGNNPIAFSDPFGLCPVRGTCTQSEVGQHGLGAVKTVASRIYHHPATQELMLSAGAALVGTMDDGHVDASEYRQYRAAMTPASRSQTIYRSGAPSPSNLKVRPGEVGVSFRNSLSNPTSGAARPVFPVGTQYFGVDASRLPKGSVIHDNEPDGHVTVTGVPPEVIKDAVVERGRLP